MANNSGEKVSFFTSDAKVTQGSKQYETGTVFDDSEDLPSEYLSGVKAEGVFVFPAVDRDKKLTLVLDSPHSDNWDRNWKNITFKLRKFIISF